MHVDADLLERWQTGWCLARGVPLPTRGGGGLVVEVGWPEQLRRHVFVDAGPALQACAARIDAPYVLLKAAVDCAQMRRALPARWTIERPGYLMCLPAPMARHWALPDGYVARVDAEHGAQLVRIADRAGETAAVGRVVVNRATAVFDRIETLEAHRRRGLGSALMCALDRLAEHGGATERLLVATEAGRELYLSLGWRVLAPYSTAVLAAPPVSPI
ncbi:MAG: GNAT family N-acetyltransferase [Pseudomonadota bacterium]|nr:GNAT family N-acetyltransferase [Pseudomonadota bacterium]